MLREIRVVELGAELPAYTMVGVCCTGTMCPVPPPAPHCWLKRTVYHELLTTFAAIMADEAKAAKLVANVTRMLAGRAQAAC